MRRFDVSILRSAGRARIPGDPEFAVRPVRWLERDDPYRLPALALGSHARTHGNPSGHLVTGGGLIGRVGLGRGNGLGRRVHRPDGLAGFPFRTRARDGGPVRAVLSAA